jgi:hypothetical protein
MICSVLFALGMTMANCVEPAPPRDQAAEVLIEQERREDDEVAAALAKRDRLYRGLGQCDDCGKLNTDPLPDYRRQ